MPKSASQWSGSPSIRGGSESTQMILLTFSLVGVVFCWSLEATYCTPYLLTLGLSKSNISLVFIAGPLSGLLMQPIVGAIADRSTSKYGRRRPLIVGGAFVVGICLILLGWTKESVSLFFHGDETYVKKIAVIVAVLDIYVIDFAINAVQACCRGLIVDILPTSKQQSGSAWASRVCGFASLISYGIGTLDLVAILPSWTGDTQFKKMTLISVGMLWIATFVTCRSVTERILISSPEHQTSIWGILPSIWQRIFNLPPRVSAICWVQFWASIGWFPFIFYSSTWVGETYYKYEHKTDISAEKGDVLGNIGRLGSVALVLWSMVGFISSVVLPYGVRSTTGKAKQDSSYTPRLPQSLPRGLQRVLVYVARLPKPRLVTMWQWSHFYFAFVMIWSPLVKSLSAATLLVALCGVPAAIGGWAPFAELGIEINRLATGSASYSALGNDSAMTNSGAYDPLNRHTVDDDDDDDIELSGLDSSLRPRSTSTIRLSHPESSKDDDDGSTGELAGVYLGVLNVYTTLPQFLGTFMGWVVFSIFEPDRSGVKDDDPDHHRWLDTKGINGISVCFFIGALCAVVAAYSTRRLKQLS